MRRLATCSFTCTHCLATALSACRPSRSSGDSAAPGDGATPGSRSLSPLPGGGLAAMGALSGCGAAAANCWSARAAGTANGGSAAGGSAGWSEGSSSTRYVCAADSSARPGASAARGAVGGPCASTAPAVDDASTAVTVATGARRDGTARTLPPTTIRSHGDSALRCPPQGWRRDSRPCESSHPSLASAKTCCAVEGGGAKDASLTAARAPFRTGASRGVGARASNEWNGIWAGWGTGGRAASAGD